MRLRSSRLIRCALAVATGAALSAVQQVDASAASVEHEWERGRVVQLSDGDTPYVDIWGDGVTTKQAIRLIDVQAPESAHYVHGGWVGKNWCHARAATARLSRLEPIGAEVHLASRVKSSNSGGRRLRTVWARQPDGRYANVQRSMVRDGYVVWFGMLPENTHNVEHHKLADQAALAGKQIWNKTWCGYGPQQRAHLQLWVHWDANNGDDMDNTHRNDEYVIVRNAGGAGTLDLSGWFLRESGPRVFQFPAGASVVAGAELRVHTGYGTRTAHDYYWGRAASVWNQVAATTFRKSAGVGDGAFLLDPQGDFRVWNTYPCVLRCGDDRAGVLRISRVGVKFPTSSKNKQYIDIHNYGSARHSLTHLVLRSWPFNYMFPAGASVAAGATLRVHIVHGVPHRASSRTDVYWDPGLPVILNSDADETDLSTPRDALIACHRWGGATCGW